MLNDDSPIIGNARHILSLLDPVIPKSSTTGLASSAEVTAPVIVGLTGLQGSGKSTYASALVSLLRRTPYNLNATTVSLDDFYHTHDNLVKLRNSNPENKLLWTRGQPGTHDEELAEQFFASTRHIADVMDANDNDDQTLRIPVFDKSLFGGEGDRVPVQDWPKITPIDVIVFEGWCIGFRPLPAKTVSEKHERGSTGQSCVNEAPDQHNLSHASTNTTADHSLSHLLQLNENLRKYCSTFMGPQNFDCLVHLDTDDLMNVYTWRLDQEHALKRCKGSGMSDTEVVGFVRGYMPS
ncbi:hypothetical protein H2198_004181 [Neophaeococcomyces mojaviensis]|uniref:Uncharacterized protein n=1 Tax=Neophaeococcomyces mojaviensis TaxID=3383035 RepID=A0ACC3A9B9_9EURO|nr:hypothetical protein H2198_004181 [Knufia sp. JES_112]